MNISCIVDVASREVSFQENYRIAAYDHNVDVIHFSIEPIEDFSLNTSSIKIAAQGPNKARHDYAVDPSTVSIEEETGYITFDWPIPQGVTEMPIGAGFKYGDRGQLIFAVCAEIISGDTVSKAWHSDDGIITVVAHLEPESGGGEDPEEEATNAQKIAQLQTNVAVMGTQIGALANGSPTPVATVAEMTDESAVYLYTGSETGYTSGNWYFWNGSAWTSGGTYGGATTSTTFNQHGVPADDFAVGVALATKANADDVGELSQLTTTAKDNLVSAINETATDANVTSDKLSELNKMFPVEPVNTTFFENLNYGVPSNVSFYNDRYINTSGTIITSINVNSIVFNVKPNTTFFLYVPSRNRQVIGETESDFVVGNTYTVLTTTNALQYNGIYVLKFTTGATAKKVIAYIYSGAYDYEANKNDIIITGTDWNPNVQPTIIDDYIPQREIVVTPRETTFFDGVNYFSDDTTIYYTDRFLNIADGQIKASVAGGNISFPCEPSTEYYIYIPNNNRGVIGESTDGVFSIGTTLNLLYSSGMSTSPYHVTTSADAKYIFVYFYSGTYDYEANKGNIVINKNSYVGNNPPFIAQEYLPSNLKNALLNKNVLIFGDSITDTCNFTINSSNETTAMTWKNPSNSYVNAGGQTIRYNMWPKMLKDMGICAEVRNYARKGASFKDATRPSGEERQNVSYQITVALNDLSNPHDVFDVDDFVPDIVIFALGTNDGAPNDTYDSAMAKTVLKSDGYSIDTSATLANLDMSKFCEAARSAFLRTRIAFPYAQFYCVLPIQRANNEVNGENLNTYLSKMAKRYGCIVIDGFAESGIVRDTNNWNALGETLKDGLHPNDKGQNMLFRAIYGSLISHYVDLEVMNQ